MRLLLSVLCLPLLAPAQDVASYQLKDGEVIVARLISVDKAADQVKYEFYAGGGSGITSRKLSEFSPHSQFNLLRTLVAADDVEGHVQLAEFAVENGLIAAGKRELFKARDLANDQAMAPDLEAKIMDEAVKVLDGLLRGMLAEGKTKDANYVLHEIMAGSRLTDAEKDHFAALVHGKVTEIEDAKAKARADRRTAELGAERQAELKPLQDVLQRGRDLKVRALKSLADQSAALEGYDAAIQEFKGVQEEAEKLTREHADDKDFAAELASLSQQAQHEMIDCMLGQASIYTIRSSFNQAMGTVGQVLAMDSQNQQALNMRARIEIAANSSGVLGGRGIAGPEPTGSGR